ncbi:DNA topoisomerase IB [Thermoleophilia bacterium SCSIO 60948]|nr:DNA topoisomerase IB [Thermoleophilia bacterium SCSIO 60948]
MPRTKRVDCSGPGLGRTKRGKGFSYHEADGTLVTDREVRERIDSLAIPPAWSEVWICPVPNGHIQATGYDSEGRKQYRYHDDWTNDQGRAKFDAMLEFGRALPAMREQLDADLRRRKMDRERILACAVRLIDLGFFRVGSDRYADEHQTYGLATVEKRHVTVRSKKIEFRFTGKGKQPVERDIADPTVRTTVRKLKGRPGPERDDLLAYRHNGEPNGEWIDVKAADINAYLKEVTGGDYSAKDFRTWNGTVIAAIQLAGVVDRATSKTARKRLKNEATKRVAEYLGNTPAVARSAYIDPRVFDQFDSGVTIKGSIDYQKRVTDDNDFVDRDKIEAAVLKLIG